MPNWVYNTLTVEGSPSSVLKLKEQMNKPFTRQHDQWNMATGQMELSESTYTNPIFAFWNIIKPTDLDTYVLQSDPKVENGLFSFKGDNWYNWNVRNWGTKWDVAVSDDNQYPETELYTDEANGENHLLVYGFNTAWGFPDEALAELSAQYPELLFTLSYEEETGWGGEHEYLRGERLDGTEYNWKCRECDYMETDEPPYCEDCDYDMCPSCGYGEPDEICQTHGVQLETTGKAEV